MKEAEKSKGKRDGQSTLRRSARTSVKRKPTSNRSKPTAAQRAGGRNQANRKAKTAANRGITNKTKPNSVDVDKEIYRLQRKSSGRKTNQSRNGKTENGDKRRRRIPTYSKSNGKTEADKKVKANTVKKPRNPPPKKAVNAAVKAMTNAGYKVPEGLKMVITFEPDAQKKKNNKNQKKN